MAAKTKKAVPSFKGLDVMLSASLAAETAEAERENVYLAEQVKVVKAMPSNPTGQKNKSRDGATLEQLKERIEWNENRPAAAGAVIKDARADLDKMLKDAKAVSAADNLSVAKAWREVNLRKADKLHDPEARRLYTAALNSVVEG